jgi:Fe-S-cluster containining protein
MRECGGCTACCKTHPIESIPKAQNTWCTHCLKGKGCDIYATRPSACAEFKCQWLMGYGSDSERPDKVRVVVDFHTMEALGAEVLMICEVSHGGLEHPFAGKALEYGFRLGKPVFVQHADGRQKAYFPRQSPSFTLTREICDACMQARVEMKYYDPL